MKLDQLPEDVLARIISLTTPEDACRSSRVSSYVHSVADSDAVWDKFLPPLSLLGSDHPLLSFSSTKHLFMYLCNNPQLIEAATKSFSIDKSTGKVCYMLSARQLSITWSSNPLYWSWKPHIQSRFPEVAELIDIWWLEIHGKVKKQVLSPNTVYAAYLVMKLANRAHGLNSTPCEVCVEVGNHKSLGMLYLNQSIIKRRDGWIEIELGEFYNYDDNDNECDEEINMWLKEVKGEHLKGGLVIQGIELRPKISTIISNL